MFWIRSRGPNGRKGLEPVPCNNPRKTMESHTRRETDNRVNRSYSQEMDSAVSPGIDDHDGQTGGSRPSTSDWLKCTTWNVRTLNQNGKFENLKREMLWMKIDILGVSDVRWPGGNKLNTNERCFIHSGHTAERGVGIMLTQKPPQVKLDIRRFQVKYCWWN